MKFSELKDKNKEELIEKKNILSRYFARIAFQGKHLRIEKCSGDQKIKKEAAQLLTALKGR